MCAVGILNKEVNVSEYWWINLSEYFKKSNIDFFTEKYFTKLEKILTSEEMGSINQNKEVFYKNLVSYFTWLLDNLIIDSINNKANNINLIIKFNKETKEFKCILIDDWKLQNFQKTKKKNINNEIDLNIPLYLNQICKNRFKYTRTKEGCNMLIFKLTKDSIIISTKKNIENITKINFSL